MTSISDFLKSWNSVDKEAIQLCDAIDNLPDHCECGDAEAHLEGSCPCCRGRTIVSEPHKQSTSCTVLLARLRADVTLLCQDFKQLATPLSGAEIGLQGLELRRGIFLAAEDLNRIATTVERLHKEVVGFRRSCDLLELHSTKRAATELRQHFHDLQISLPADRVDPPTGAEKL